MFKYYLHWTICETLTQDKVWRSRIGTDVVLLIWSGGEVQIINNKTEDSELFNSFEHAAPTIKLLIDDRRLQGLT